MKKKILLLLMSSVLVFPSLSFASDTPDEEGETVECCESISSLTQQVCCDSDCKTYLKMMNRAPDAECGWVTGTAGGECCITDYGTNLNLTVTQTCCEAVTTTETVFKSNQCCVKDTPFALAIPGNSMSEMTKECCELAGGKWVGDVCCVENRPRLFKGKDSSGKVIAGDLNEKCCANIGHMWMGGYCCTKPGFTVECKDAKGEIYHRLKTCSTEAEAKKDARSKCQQAMTQDGD